MPLSVDLILDEGIPPHYDPLSQRCEKITRDGAEYWQITTLSFDELHDTDEKKIAAYAAAIERRLRAVEEWITRAESLQSQQAQETLLAYKEVLQQSIGTVDGVPRMAMSDVITIATELNWPNRSMELA